MSGVWQEPIVRLRSVKDGVLGAVVGTGTLLETAQGGYCVLTCAHVLNDALGRDLYAADRPPADQIFLFDLPSKSGSQTYQASVLEWRQPRWPDERVDHHVADVALLKVLSGDVPGSVRNVDLEKGALRLPESKTGRKTIYLNPPALDVLKALPNVSGNPFVIAGHRPGAHMVNLQKPWRRVRERAGLSDVRIHDLRYSFASVAVASGLTLPVIGKLLGHTKSATTERYAHLADDPLRAANDRIGEELSKALGR